MFAMKPWIHRQNRQLVDRYLDMMWHQVMPLLLPFQSLTLHRKIRAHFQGYIEAEENRLRENMKIIRYRLDDLTTLGMVTGPGRIEQVRSYLKFQVSSSY